MHEWALAQAVVSTVLEIAERDGWRKVFEVRIQIGELQQIDHEIFDFSLSFLRTPILEKTTFHIDSVPAELHCRVCEHTWELITDDLDDEVSESIHFIPEVAHSYLKCPKCGSPDFEIMKGRGVWLASIQGGK
ncbi:MAG: hydrogenase nickel incorporation protein HypA [Candidatus Bathyarchaeia archaeon]